MICICKFAIYHHRPVPWRAAHRGNKNPKLTAWEQTIQWHARLAMGAKPPVQAAVLLGSHFYLRDQGNLPDLTNLIKGLEDALQGIIYVNDTQVVAHLESHRYFVTRAQEEGARVGAFLATPHYVARKALPCPATKTAPSGTAT